jgi:hypothetical protein
LLEAWSDTKAMSHPGDSASLLRARQLLIAARRDA